MDLDDMLYRYFGARELDEVPPRGAERRHRTHASGSGHGDGPRATVRAVCLLHMLGGAPELDVTFNDAADREAARNFMDMLATSGDE